MTLAEVQTQFLTILHPKAAPPRLGHRGHVATVCVAREIRQRAVCYEGTWTRNSTRTNRVATSRGRGGEESLTATSSRRIEGVEQLLASASGV